MRHLVTGAPGFLGAELAGVLLERGASVLGVGRRAQGFLSPAVPGATRCEFGQRSVESLTPADLEGVHTVFHLASLQPHSPALTFDDFYAANAAPTLSLLRSARAAGVERVVFVSSTAVHAVMTQPTFLNEATPVGPPTPYGLSKVVVERLLEIELAAEVSSVAVRLPSIYGVNHLGGLAHTYLDTLRRGGTLEVYSEGRRFRNLIHGRDAAELLASIAEHTRALDQHEIFIAGSADSLPTLQIAEILRRELGSAAEVVPVGIFPRSDTDVFIDSGKAVSQLGYEPRPLAEGLARYVREAAT